MNINLVYASLTGNTEALSELIVGKFKEEKNLDIQMYFVEDMDDFSILEESDAFIIATYTYGEGDLPDEMEELFEGILDLNLKGKIFGVIGTGDTIYDEYCVCVDQFDEQIKKTGAINPTKNLKIEIEADCDEDFENIDKFIEDFSAAL
ncbi:MULTISPECIES: flavodoxin domain-containing protein [unclassified Gemella]|uniref:flavodoxin domain-containing protein n=1 Tax=unclassified Gemella TaxID=2624949 RepID=UPI001C04945C|nr:MULTISPECIES: flavodoxin domain-containing protein [unclassified Gemella]MBU0279090.1 flavodoxin domain-containing protein [Gemella sp. zg-1178]QWQ39186.1 flavodoxin domain-containing protein [Gemella sp. zg-570]